MAVGPSAPPMMPIAPACFSVKPRSIAPTSAMKTPICAAAPSKSVDGRASSGPKSVIAPMPRKMSGGKISNLIPKLMAIMTPISSRNPVFGKFARMQPNAIGPKSSGSNSLAMAMYKSTRPTRIIMPLPTVNDAKPLFAQTACSDTTNAFKSSMCSSSLLPYSTVCVTPNVRPERFQASRSIGRTARICCGP